MVDWKVNLDDDRIISIVDALEIFIFEDPWMNFPRLRNTEAEEFINEVFSVFHKVTKYHDFSIFKGLILTKYFT